MTRVLVTGAGGQLGRELGRAGWDPSVEVVSLPSALLDITDADAVGEVVATIDPDVIVNAAAYTAVDKAEDDAAAAFAVNTAAVGTLATAADRVAALLIHVSTDYVFDGSTVGWYHERDPVAPLGVYGRSKAMGEQAALAAERSLVLRVSWLYGAMGPNFVTTMLRLARERDEIGVVDDQRGCPTAAGDVAQAIVGVVTMAGGRGEPRGLYHLAAPDDATWYELAAATFEASAHGFPGTLRPLASHEYPTPARRPANSRLDSGRIAELGIRLPSWRESLPTIVAERERALV